MSNQDIIATLTQGPDANNLYKTSAEANAATEVMLLNMITKQLPSPAATQLTIKTEIKEAFRDPEFQGDLVALMKSALCEEFGTKVNALEEKVSALIERVQTLEASKATMTAQLQTLEAKQPALADQVQTLEARQSSTQQRTIMAQSGKANNVLLSGVAETPDEAPAAIIKKLAADINIKLGAYTARRVGKPRPNKTRPILVSCDMYWDKRRLYAARTTLKDCGYENTYINEDLPPRQGELYFHARQAKNQKLATSTWTDHGVVFIKLRSEDQAVQVSSLDNLKHLIKDYKPKDSTPEILVLQPIL
jgi:TolA-binding protein